MTQFKDLGMEFKQHALSNWLERAYSDIIADDDEEVEDGAATSVEKQLLRVGSDIFEGAREETGGNTSTTTGGLLDLFQIREEICKCLGAEQEIMLVLTNHSIEVTIEACLVCAMSERNVNRPFYVQGIMGMEASLQVFLMQAIKGKLNSYLLEQKSGVGNDENENDELNSTNNSTFTSNDGDNESNNISPLKSTTSLCFSPFSPVSDKHESPEKWGAGALEGSIIVKDQQQEAAKVEQRSASANAGKSPNTNCRVCVDKDEVIERLTQDVEAALARAHDLELHFKGELAVETNKLVDVELQVIDKEEQISSRDFMIQDSTAKIVELEARLTAHMTARKELLKLQDEVDVLRPKADKADAAEVQIEKMRDRLEELTGVKQQLKTETSAHTETYTRLLAIEQEVESLRKTKSQLEEYRGQYAESLITIQELTVRLKQKNDELVQLQSNVQSLSGDQQGQLLQTQHLAEELRFTSEQLREVERAGGIGEGMSEFNPALMQELNKLRTSNVELLERLEASSLESLDRLEKDLSDQRCMSASLQQKWMDTKDALARALATISQLNNKIALLECDKSSLLFAIQESTAMGIEDRRSTMTTCASRESAAETRANDAIYLNNLGRRAVTEEMSNELSNVRQELAVSRFEFKSLLEVKNDLDAMLSTTVSTLDALRAEQQQQQVEAMASLVEQDRVHVMFVDRLHEQQSEQIRLLESNHLAAMAIEADRLLASQADFDEEIIRRRKLEREKRFLESELHNHKSQLLMSGGGGTSTGLEVDAALKELKTMQVALDQTNAENEALRARIVG